MLLQRVIILLLVAPMTLCSACMPGLLYTDMTTPLTTNFDNTPVGTKSVTVDSKEIRLPLPRGSVSSAWSSRALGDAARKGGLKSIYYADERVISVLAGIWKRRIVTVYGDPEDDALKRTAKNAPEVTE